MVGSNVSLETPGKAMLGVLGRNHVLSSVCKMGQVMVAIPELSFLGQEDERKSNPIYI